MEIQEVTSEIFQDTSLFEAKPDSGDSSLKELDNAFAQIKLKSLKAGSMLPNLHVYTTSIKTSKKKKSHRHENKYATGLYSAENNSDTLSSFKDDWSKQSCDEFFVPVESFLDSQLKREKSSKRRCKQIEKQRSMENNKRYMEERISEYDEKISLNVLLKQSKSCSIQVSNPMNNTGQLNYRALMAEEIIRKNSRCNRCIDRTRKYEDNIFLRSINFGLNKPKKKNNYAFPTLVAPKVAQTSQTFYHSSGYQQMLNLQQNQHAQFQEISYRNLADSSSGEHVFKSLNTLINLDANPFSSSRKPFMSKLPIEVQKKHVFWEMHSLFLFLIYFVIIVLSRKALSFYVFLFKYTK